MIVKRALKSARAGNPVLILCREIEHVNLLGDTFNAEVGRDVDGSQFVKCWSGAPSLDENVSQFATGAVPIMIASPMFGEGVDLPGDQVRLLINAEGLKS